MPGLYGFPYHQADHGSKTIAPGSMLRPHFSFSFGLDKIASLGPFAPISLANPEIVITCSQKYLTTCPCLRQLALCIRINVALLIPGMFFLKAKSSREQFKSPFSSGLSEFPAGLESPYRIHNLNHVLLLISLEHRQF